MSGEPAPEDEVERSRLRSALSSGRLDTDARLRLSERMFHHGEWSAVREALLPLEAMIPPLGPTGQGVAAASSTQIEPSQWAQAVAMLAHIDEQEGKRQDAIRRWDTLLGMDIDHPQARASLIRLRTGTRTTPAIASPEAGATLLSPEGARTTRYEIRKEVGRGATSTVYLARDVRLNIDIALKVLHPAMHAAARARARERFFWEARAAAQLRHPGVVAVYDLDEKAHTLAMEYLPGGTLRSRLSSAGEGGQPGPLPPGEITIIARRLLSTLAHVHGTGLVHGDLKPRNILLRETADPVLGDFGVSRLLQDEDRTREQPAGTPLYLAPEQLRGAPSSVATDLFAMGAILWEMAAGRPMRTRSDLTSGHYDPVDLPARARAHLGPLAATVGPLIEALIEMDAAARPANAQDALQVLIPDVR